MSAQPQRLGRYEIIGFLAQGGMAELFLARLAGIEGFAKRVVIKRVLPGLARDRDFVQMFLEEARLAATLHHQNIVQVHDIGYDEAGGYFFAMELLHGEHVGRVLHALSMAGREMPLQLALEVARGACAGLHYAHERVSPSGTPLGLVHRDVSPQNLFLTFDGGVKLLDFGIAKAVERISSHVTRSGTLRGKLPYMSPEQCQAEPLDRRSDLFSLSVVLWEMTVGERLFGGDNEGDFEILKAIVEHDPPPPSSRKPGYPAELERIIMRGLERDPTRRYQSADEMQSDLEGFVRTSRLWVSSRDLAALMRELFPDQAQAWQQTEKRPSAVTRAETAAAVPGVQAAPARWTDELSPPPLEPQPRRQPGQLTRELGPAEGGAPAVASDRAPRAPLPQNHSASDPTRGARVALLVGAILALGGAAGIGYSLGHSRGSGAEVGEKRGLDETPPTGSTEAGTPGRAVAAPRSADQDDEHWFQPGDFLIAKEPFEGEKLTGLVVGKMLGSPGARGDADFLTASGKEIESAHYFVTRVARAEDLSIGVLAFCPVYYVGDQKSRALKNRADSRQSWWSAGRVTDTAPLADGRVMVADVDCELRSVRVPAAVPSSGD